MAILTKVEHRNCGHCGKNRTATIHQLNKLGWTNDRCPKHKPKEIPDGTKHPARTAGDRLGSNVLRVVRSRNSMLSQREKASREPQRFGLRSTTRRGAARR